MMVFRILNHSAYRGSQTDGPLIERNLVNIGQFLLFMVCLTTLYTVEQFDDYEECIENRAVIMVYFVWSN
jgi:hypothetical protein